MAGDGTIFVLASSQSAIAGELRGTPTVNRESYEAHRNIQADAYDRESADFEHEKVSHTRSYRTMAKIVAARIKVIAGSPCPRVLEVGCGTGLFTTQLAAIVPNASIVSTDAFSGVLAFAKKRLAHHQNVTIVQRDALDDYRDLGPFDFVCGADILHHIETPDAALARWGEATRRGGSLLILESNPRNPFLRWRTRNRPEEARFPLNTRTNLRAWLTQGGWEVVEVSHLSFYLPSGPPRLAGILNRLEQMIAYGNAFWGDWNGMFLLEARRGEGFHLD